MPERFPSARSTPKCWQWQSLQLGLLFFFWLPSVGAVILGVTKLSVVKQLGRQWWQQPLNRAWAGIFLWMLGGSAIAIAPIDALLGMANIIPFGLLVTALIVLVRTPNQLRRISQILVLMAAPMLVLGTGQLLWDWSTPLWWSKIFGWSLVAGGTPPGRMAAGLIYANLYGCYLLVMLPLTLGLWGEVYRRFQQPKLQPSPLLWAQLGGLTLAIFGTLAGLFATQSRSAWFLTLVCLIAFLFYIGWHWLILMIFSGLGAIAWASWLPAWGGHHLRTIIPSLIWSRLSGEMYPDEQQEVLRSVQWQFCLDLMKERPWTGWGLRSFEPLYNYGEHAADHYHWVAHPHNLFMMLGAELGLPLTLALCVWIAWCCYPCVRWFKQFPQSDRLILFSCLVAFGLVIGFNLLDISLFDLRTNLLGWLVLGLLAGVGHAQQKNIHRKISAAKITPEAETRENSPPLNNT